MCVHIITKDWVRLSRTLLHASMGVVEVLALVEQGAAIKQKESHKKEMASGFAPSLSR